MSRKRRIALFVVIILAEIAGVAWWHAHHARAKPHCDQSPLAKGSPYDCTRGISDE